MPGIFRFRFRRRLRRSPIVYFSKPALGLIDQPLTFQDAIELILSGGPAFSNTAILVAVAEFLVGKTVTQATQFLDQAEVVRAVDLTGAATLEDVWVLVTDYQRTLGEGATLQDAIELVSAFAAQVGALAFGDFVSTMLNPLPRWVRQLAPGGLWSRLGTSTTGYGSAPYGSGPYGGTGLGTGWQRQSPPVTSWQRVK